MEKHDRHGRERTQPENPGKEEKYMNAKQRCMAVLQKQRPDHTPFFPLLMFFAADRAGINFRTFSVDPVALAEAQLNMFENYRVDAVTACSDSFRISADFGAEIAYPENQTPYAVRPLLETHSDLKAIMQMHLDPMRQGSRMRQRVDSVEILARSIGDRALICGWVEMPFAEVCDWFGVENLMYLLFDDPELVHSALEFAAELQIEFARAQIEAGADMIGCGDAAASLISAEQFAEFALPYERRVTEGIRAAGGLSKLHICGNTAHSLHLLAQSGADLVNIDSMVDIGAACEQFGKAGIPFKGNADPVRDLMNATPEQARAKGLEILRRTKGHNFMLSAGCELPAKTSDEVYFAFADTVLEQL